MPRARIGISGFAYPHWRGHFYPKGVKDADRLAYYAQHFDTVEINSTFYRPPRAELLTRWREATPENFLFAVKAWRRFTHFKRLDVDASELAKFIEWIKRLEPKLGPVLFQFPADFEADVALLATFLRKLPRSPRYAFELRHATWWTKPVRALLQEHGAAFCIFDLRKVTSPLAVTADFVYVRVHGPKRPYFDHYSPAVLRTWARRIKAWRAKKLDVYFFFNNTDEAAATGDAKFLKSSVVPRATGQRKRVSQS